MFPNSSILLCLILSRASERVKVITIKDFPFDPENFRACTSPDLSDAVSVMNFVAKADIVACSDALNIDFKDLLQFFLVKVMNTGCFNVHCALAAVYDAHSDLPLCNIVNAIFKTKIKYAFADNLKYVIQTFVATAQPGKDAKWWDGYWWGGLGYG